MLLMCANCKCLGCYNGTAGYYSAEAVFALVWIPIFLLKGEDTWAHLVLENLGHIMSEAVEELLGNGNLRCLTVVMAASSQGKDILA